MIKQASYFEKVDSKVKCLLCPAECLLSDNEYGICGCRFNREGKLYTDNYAQAVTLAVDPIEKKPLYHFYPGQQILSTGANGCNLGCLHCQNWTISQQKVDTVKVTVEDLLTASRKYGSIGVAYTYTEPLIWFEYIMDCAPILRDAGQKIVLVSNGYINSEPLEELIPYIDAVNIDLKGMRPEFYKKICKGKVEPVLKNIERFADSNVHLEITNLLISGLNDSDDEINELVDFVASLSDMIPLHFSAYRPEYKLTAPTTPTEKLLRAKKLAQTRLKFVYLGNTAVREGSDTFCPSCGSLLVERSGYSVNIYGLERGRCTDCNAAAGIIQ